MPQDNIGIKFTTIGGQQAIAQSASIAKAMEGINMAQMKLVRSQTTAAGITRTYQTSQQRLVTSTQKAGQAQEKYTKIVKDTTLAKKGLFGQTQSVLSAVGKVATWMVATTAVFGLFRALGGLVKTLMEFDDAMARVSTATRGGAEALLKVKNAVKEYGRTTSASLMEVAKAMYLLGSAGLTASEQVAGLEHVMDLTVGTMGQVDQVARLVSGAYNVFGQNLEGAITASEKMQQISDIMAYTFSTQQIELSEIASAMGLVGSVAGLIEMPLNVLVGTLGELNTSLLKGCYDDDTEILTDQGWKFFKNLNKTEKVATLNPETFEIEYQKPTEYINEPYKGKMYRVKNRYIDIKVTPNHKILSRYGRKSCKTRKYTLRRADEVYGKEQTFIRGGKWKGKKVKRFSLPPVDTFNGGFRKIRRRNKSIGIGDWLRFLAYYLAEGSISVSKKEDKSTAYHIRVYQYEGEKKDIMRKTIERMPFNFYEGKKSFGVSSKQLYFYLKKFGKSHEKHIPDFVKKLSPSLIRIFIKAYALGDGRIRNNCIEITTSSTRMRDDFEEIGLKAGYAVSHAEYTHDSTFNRNHKIWKIYLSNRTEISFWQKKNLHDNRGNYNRTTIERWEDYDGYQYCVEVKKYHTLFVRRNGKTLWCGNTRAGTSIMNALLQISKKSDMLTDKLGVVFDPTKPLDFVDIMEKLNRKYGEGALSVMELKELMDVFGLRGGRAVGIILNRYEKWVKTVNKGKQDFEGFAELMREQFEDTLPRQLAIIGNDIKVAFIDMFEESGNALTRLLAKINKATKTRREEAAEIERSMEALIRLEEVSLGIPRISPRLKELEYTKEGYEVVLKGLGLQDNLIGKLARRKDIGELILTDQKEMVGRIKDEDQAAKGLLEALEKGAKTQGDMNQKIEAARPLLEKLLGIAEARAFILSGMVENGIRNLENAKEEVAITKDLLYSTERGLVAEDKRHKIQMMRMDGYSDEQIAHQNLVDFVEEINAAKRKDMGTTENIVTLNQLLVATDKERLVLMAQLGGNLEKNVLKFSKLVNQEFEAAQKLTASIADNLERAVEGGIEALLTGTKDWKEALQDIGKVMLRAQISEVGKAIRATGIFKTVASGIVTAHKTGGDYVASRITGAYATVGAGVSRAGAGLPPGGGLGLPIGMARPPGEPAGWDPRMGRMPARPKPTGGTWQTYAKAGISGAMAGYGMGGGAGGAIGGMLGGMAGMALAATPLAPLAPLMPLLGGWLGGLFGGGKKEPQIERKEEDRASRVTSKLDITNKQLEWVNRNLVALKVAQEPYPMPESAYFAERWGGRGGGATFGNIIIHVGTDAQGGDVADAFAERFIVHGNRILQ